MIRRRLPQTNENKRVSVRFTPQLNERLRRIADTEGVSINALVNHMVNEAMKRRMKIEKPFTFKIEDYENAVQGH